MPIGKRKGAKHRKEPDPLARAVGERIRRLRLEMGFNFDSFVEECGLGRGYVSELERGFVVPTITALKHVADAIGVTLADLVVADTERERLFDVARALREADVRRLLRLAERARRVVPADQQPYEPIPDPRARAPGPKPPRRKPAPRR